MPNWTTLKLIEWTTEYFTKHGIPNPRLDAELLLSHVLKKKRIELYLEFEKAVSEKDLAAFKELIQRRAKREPLQYIIGTVDFYGVTIKVTPAVLIPRPETELLVEQVLKRCHSESVHPELIVSLSNDEGWRAKNPVSSSGRTGSFPPNGRRAGADAQDDIVTILDLCTGSGCIIAALANELPNAHFIGTDISAAALDVARQNTERWKERVELLQGNLFEPLSPPPLPSPLEGEGQGEGVFDLITSNPPYIPECELATLQPEVRDFEPKEALIAGKDGLEIIREIINNARRFLKPGGHLVMEIGDKQAEAVKEIIAKNGNYGEVEVVKDYGGIERIIVACHPEAKGRRIP